MNLYNCWEKKNILEQAGLKPLDVITYKLDHRTIYFVQSQLVNP